MKELLIKALELIEAIEDTRQQIEENTTTADHTDIPAYREVCIKLVYNFRNKVDLLEQRLDEIKKQLKAVL